MKLLDRVLVGVGLMDKVDVMSARSFDGAQDDSGVTPLTMTSASDDPPRPIGHPSLKTSGELSRVDHTKPMAYWGGGYGRGYGLGFAISFNGEKSQGGIGPIMDYKMDHQALASRAWQLYIDSDDFQILIGKYALWSIGNGLKLQAAPAKLALKTLGYQDDLTDFNETVESLFDLYANSTLADHSGMQTLHDMAKDAYITAKLSGNTLCIIRYDEEDGFPKMQLIDGVHLCNPQGLSMLNSDLVDAATGNRIRNGVELNKKGEHVAYHVRTGLLDTERIPARIGKHKIVQAFLIKGMKHRLDTVLGIPRVTGIMETAKKIERYTQATLERAEEVAKVALAIEHNKESTGENPFADAVAAAYKGEGDGQSNDTAQDVNGEQLRNHVVATTGRQVVNLTQGATIKTLEADADKNYSDFSGDHRNKMYATMFMPPSVAKGIHDTSYSSSRANSKEWEHTLGVDRTEFSVYYKHVYNYWLYVMVLKGIVQAPGYLKALSEGNKIVIEAYTKARWIGATVPHIDPLKEVMAKRAAMGPMGALLPLTTGEMSTEDLANGDYKENVAQFVDEYVMWQEICEKAGLTMPSFEAILSGNYNNAAKKDEGDDDKKPSGKEEDKKED